MPPSLNCKCSAKRTKGSIFRPNRFTITIGLHISMKTIITVCFSFQRLQKSPQQGHHPQESQRLQAEINALKQRLQETNSRGEHEMEQWRKVVETEKNRADQSEKAANEMHQHVQVHVLTIQYSLLQFAYLNAYLSLKSFRCWRKNCNSRSNK